jgi:IclR family transcriptional regulator, pca regulon regulatory protein
MSIHARRAAPPQPPARPDDKEFMATLAKGLAVLGAFGKERPTMTLSEAAAATGTSRATARRILRTLAELGYVEQNGRQFALTANILRLGFAYLGSQSWIDRALPLLRELAERSQESCSAAMLEGSEIVYVARVPARRIMSMALSVGSRLPAFHTALGRIQLGFLDEDELWRRLKSLRIGPFTPYTITDLQAIIDRIRDDHAQNFSVVDEELELGLRALAVPVVDRRNELVAAINMSTHASRTTRNEMRTQFLPELQRVAAQITLLLP